MRFYYSKTLECMHIVGDLLAESFTLGMRFLYTGDAVPQEIEEC